MSTLDLARARRANAVAQIIGHSPTRKAGTTERRPTQAQTICDLLFPTSPVSASKSGMPTKPTNSIPDLSWSNTMLVEDLNVPEDAREILPFAA